MKTTQLLFFVAALLVALTPTSADAQALAWYPFEDGSADDASGNGHDGVLNGSPTMEPGIVGNALRLHRGDSITVPHDVGLQAATPSINFWIYLEPGRVRPARLVRKVASGVGFTVSIIPGGQVRFDISEGPNRASVVSPFPIVGGVWTTVFVSYDGTDAKLYLHGELVATVNAPGIDPTNEADLHLGARLGGLIDEVKLGASAGTAPFACRAALKVWHPASKTCLNTVTDVAAAEGLEDTGNRSFGATLVDIDQDGWIDLYYVNGAGDPEIPVPGTGTCPTLPDPIPFFNGSKNALHMNQGDGTFGPDTAEEVGLADQWNAMRHVWADYDRDGLRDVFSHNFVLSTLYKQTLGDPMTFEDWNDEASFHVCLKRGTGASWIDLNQDGYLDLNLVEYDPTRLAVDHLNLTFLNDTFGGFTDVTDLTGLNLPDNPMGQSWADFDNDGDQDLFQTNSHEVPTRLYRNNGIDMGTGVPTFTDIASDAGVSVIGEPARGIGASWGDYNNDRRLDLLFVREQDTRLYRNNGPDEFGDWSFTDVSAEGNFDSVSGLAFWGGGFADLDNNGWLDIVLSNRFNGVNRVLLSNGDGSWREVTSELGMELEERPSMGFVAGDRDNDGDVDLVIVSHSPPPGEPDDIYVGDPNSVWVNNERGNNWVKFRLTGTVSNLEAVGARIEVQASLQPGDEAVWQSREVNAGTGFFSDFPRVQTFGLGKAQVVEQVRIKWPSGFVQTFGPLGINQLFEFVEPTP